MTNILTSDVIDICDYLHTIGIEYYANIPENYQLKLIEYMMQAEKDYAAECIFTALIDGVGDAMIRAMGHSAGAYDYSFCHALRQRILKTYKDYATEVFEETYPQFAHERDLAIAREDA